MSGTSILPIIFKSVLFPEPDAPRIQINPLSGKVRLIFFNTLVLLYDLFIFFLQGTIATHIKPQSNANNQCIYNIDNYKGRW